MRLTDLNIIYKAAKLIRDKFDIDFAITLHGALEK